MQRKLHLLAHLVKPIRIMRLIVINGSPKRIKLRAGDTCGYYQPLLNQDVISGNEAKTLALRAFGEVRQMQHLKPDTAETHYCSCGRRQLESCASSRKWCASARLRQDRRTRPARPGHGRRGLRRPHGATVQHPSARGRR